MQVAIFFGSKSDTEVMRGAANALKEFGVEYKALYFQLIEYQKN